MSITTSGSDACVNPWLPLCSVRLTALDDPSIPLTEVKSKYAQELRWVEEARSAIRYRLNKLSPVSRLTSEVLAHIFRRLADIERPSRMQIPKIGWMKVTHVCRSWRNIALDYHDLWGRGSVCSLPSWTEERLRRSKKRLIEVTDGFHRLIPPSVIANSHRIKCVDFHTGIAWKSVHKSWHDLFSSPAISLESFTYEFAGGDGTYDYRIVPYDPLPVDIFDRRAPQLKQVSLTHALLPFESPIYDNLAHLYLSSYRTHGSAGDHPVPFTRRQLLALLHRMPKLETLVLHQAIPYTQGQLPLPISVPVTLSSLKRLQLKDYSHEDCLALVEQLSIPPAASVGICIMARPRGLKYDGRDHVGEAFVPMVLRQSDKGDSIRPIQTMSFRFDPWVWRFLSWKEPMHTTQMDSRCRNPYFGEATGLMGLQINGQPYCDIWMNHNGKREFPVLVILRPILNGICTSNIKILDIGGESNVLQIEWSDWFHLFGSFTSVEDLTLHGEPVAFGFIDAFGLDLTLNLTTSTGSPCTNDMPHVLFPNLRCLKFFMVFFDQFMRVADATLSELMTAALIERYAMNTKLEEIHLLECNWKQRWVDALGRIGPKVFCKDTRWGYDCSWLDHEMPPSS